jgi:hypothetical protein
MQSNLANWGDMMMEEDERNAEVVEDFPELSGFKVKGSKKKNRVQPVVVDHTPLPLPVDSKEVTKTLICKSLKEGQECSFGNHCKFIHFIDELININECVFGERCNRVKISKNNVINIKNTSPCIYFHPNETEHMFLLRHGVKNIDLMDRIKFNFEKFKFTRMCDKDTCDDNDCTYAHSVEQLKVFPCKFGGECHFITKKDSCVENVKDSDKICFFLHDEETMENYEKRVITNRKRKSEEELNLLKPKKMKVETVIEKKMEEPKICVEEKEPVKVVIKEKVIEDKIIINVPIHMAMEMLQIMLKSGKTNFELKTY